MAIKLKDGKFDYAYLDFDLNETFLELYVPGVDLYTKDRDYIVQISINGFTFYCMETVKEVKNRGIKPDILYILKPSPSSTDMFCYYCTDYQKKVLIYSTWVVESDFLRKKLYYMDSTGTGGVINNDGDWKLILLDLANKERSNEIILEHSSYNTGIDYTHSTSGEYIRGEEFALICGSFTANFPTENMMWFMTPFEGPNKAIEDQFLRVYNGVQTDEVWNESITTNNPMSPTPELPIIYNPSLMSPALTAWSILQTNVITKISPTDVWRPVEFTGDSINYEPHGAVFVWTKLKLKNHVYIEQWHRCMYWMTPFDSTQGMICHLVWKPSVGQPNYYYYYGYEYYSPRNMPAIASTNSAAGEPPNLWYRYPNPAWKSTYPFTRYGYLVMYVSGYYNTNTGQYEYAFDPTDIVCQVEIYELNTGTRITTLKKGYYLSQPAGTKYNINCCVVSALLKGPEMEDILDTTLYDPVIDYNSFYLDNTAYPRYIKDIYTSPLPIYSFIEFNFTLPFWQRRYNLFAYGKGQSLGYWNYGVVTGTSTGLTINLQAESILTSLSNSDISLSLTYLGNKKSILIDNDPTIVDKDTWVGRVQNHGYLSDVYYSYGEFSKRGIIADFYDFGYGAAGNIRTDINTTLIEASETQTDVSIYLNKTLLGTATGLSSEAYDRARVRTITGGRDSWYQYNDVSNYPVGNPQHQPTRLYSGTWAIFDLRNVPQLDLTIPAKIYVKDSTHTIIGYYYAYLNHPDYDGVFGVSGYGQYAYPVVCFFPQYQTADKASYGSNVLEISHVVRDKSKQWYVCGEHCGVFTEDYPISDFIYISAWCDYSMQVEHLQGYDMTNHVFCNLNIPTCSHLIVAMYIYPSNLHEEYTYTVTLTISNPARFRYIGSLVVTQTTDNWRMTYWRYFIISFLLPYNSANFLKYNEILEIWEVCPYNDIYSNFIFSLYEEYNGVSIKISRR